MSKKDPEFYKRMQEAKARKKQALEQAQLHAEFLVNPHLYNAPGVPKTEAELKLDNALKELQQKLRAEQPKGKWEQVMEQFNNIDKGQ